MESACNRAHRGSNTRQGAKAERNRKKETYNGGRESLAVLPVKVFRQRQNEINTLLPFSVALHREMVDERLVPAPWAFK